MGKKFDFKWLILIIVSVAVVGALLLMNPLVLPKNITYALSTDSFNLLALSFTQFLLLLGTGLFLLYRWRTTGKNNKTTLSWGVAFTVASLIVIESVLPSLNIILKGEVFLKIFALVRITHIIFLAGMYYGLALMMTSSKRIQIIPAVMIILVSLAWFIYGLFIVKNVAVTMTGFLYFISIPLTAVIAYMFLWYGNNNSMASFKLIGFGFMTLTLIFLSWPLTFNAATDPPSATPLWTFGYHLFNILSLLPIFIGFILIPYEKGDRTP
ncbi:MAG TPA: hypothetical protein VI894_03510 [Candidatus Nanoarchaeia archaeon]|nr:hypothetical protein [Candidatus Nanoarchaeia archaeon]